MTGVQTWLFRSRDDGSVGLAGQDVSGEGVVVRVGADVQHPMGLFRSVINLPGLVFLENLYRLVLEDLNGVVAEGVVVAALVGLEQPLSPWRCR